MQPRSVVTLPCSIEKNDVWFVTRRTVRRTFLLKPEVDGIIQQLYWYATAVTAAETGILLYAAVVMSTHMHEALQDRLAELPDFLRDRNRLFANMVKCYRGWDEEVFGRGGVSKVKLYGANTIAQKIAYTIANPVAAGLVSDPRDWPGVTTSIDDLGVRTVSVKRPTLYLDPLTKWPEVASIQLHMPQQILDAMGSLEGAREMLRNALDVELVKARDKAKSLGVKIGNAARVLKAKFTQRASTPEPFGERNPRFAAGGDRALAALAVAAYRDFQSRYRAALEKLRSGVRDVVFPRGTWRMRVDYGVRVED